MNNEMEPFLTANKYIQLPNLDEKLEFIELM